MIKKIKAKASATVLASGAWLAIATTKVLATQDVIETKTAADVSEKIISVLNNILMPIGGLVVFVTVIIAAFKIITTANKPQERAEAMSSLPYIVGGGLLLGGAMMASGLIYGLMKELQTAYTILPMLPV